MHSRAATLLVLFLATSAYAAEPRSSDGPPTVSKIDRAQQLRAYMLAASAFLGVEQVVALSKITDEHRRHLAMTYYLRAGDSVSSRWSWTSEQIRAYQKSPTYSAAIAEIGKISDRFSLDNPEYVVQANPQVRSLEEQLALWQTVTSVGEAASELREAALETLAQESYGKDPDDVSIGRFRAFLDTWRGSGSPTVVAPGLSLHGQGRAYDFQILDSNGLTIADTDTSTIGSAWDEPGWTEKLSNAVHAASDKFVGPLLKPYEPWHYEYQADQ
ncbi:MAG: hypothetical protein ABR587_15610 [Candidatus Binatia bacterium]